MIKPVILWTDALVFLLVFAVTLFILYARRKPHLALLVPTVPGWKCECIGDDIAWMKIREDGRLHAINPEAGFLATSRSSMKSDWFGAVSTGPVRSSPGHCWPPATNCGSPRGTCCRSKAS